MQKKLALKAGMPAVVAGGSADTILAVGMLQKPPQYRSVAKPELLSAVIAKRLQWLG